MPAYLNQIFVTSFFQLNGFLSYGVVEAIMWVRAVCVVILFFSIPALWKEVNKGFRLEKLLLAEGVIGDASACINWDGKLRQDFYYLGQGTQSYVFASEDGKHVLKLFRFEQASNPVYRFIRTKIRGKKLRLSRQAQIQRLFSACRIAEQLASEETALEFLHLHASQVGLVRLHLPVQGVWEVNLDRYCFALQEKAERIFPSLLASNPEQRERKLASFQALLEKRAAKGIVNLDSDLHRNFGFIGDRAIEMDFGAYEVVSREVAEKNKTHFMDKLQVWLGKH